MISQKNPAKSCLVYMRAILRSRLVFALYLWCHESLPHLLYPLHLLSIFSDMNTNNHVFDAIFFVTIRVFMQNVLQVLPSIYEKIFKKYSRSATVFQKKVEKSCLIYSVGGQEIYPVFQKNGLKSCLIYMRTFLQSSKDSHRKEVTHKTTTQLHNDIHPQSLLRLPRIDSDGCKAHLPIVFHSRI